MDLDVVPVGEVPDNRPIALAVVGLEGLEGLVGEHHSEAESVVRTVALEHGDMRRRPRLLHQRREIEAGRPPADDVNLHALLQGIGPDPSPGPVTTNGGGHPTLIILSLKYSPDKLEVSKF